MSSQPERRGFEGPMDWEYQDQGPLDFSSPFSQVTQRKKHTASFESPSKYGSKQTPNPFAAAAAAASPFKVPTQNQQPQPPPPHSSIFTPQLKKEAYAPQFRNPAFTTPQKRVEERFADYSGLDSSPAMTETSEVPQDTPEPDREGDDHVADRNGEGGTMTITPNTTARSLFGHMRSGRGEVPRGNKSDLIHRDKVRKRKRQHGDRDVGSVRSRVPRGYDDSESDWDGESAAERDDKERRRRGGKRAQGPGFFGAFLGAIRDHPSVPLILSWWVQLAINVFIVSICMWGIWSFISMMRADLAHATEAARAVIVGEMEACAYEFTKNQCAPKATRMPALDKVCDEWEMCMNQDPSSVMKVQVSAKNVAEIINEFVGVMSLKAWGFILSTLMVALLANNIGFGRFREAALETGKAQPAFPSQPAGHPMLASPQHNPNQAYIWAPVPTPRHIRRGYLADDATDTDASPSDIKSIMAPPQTPSDRRSPTKGERGRSPTKGSRSPSKGY